MLSLRRQNSPSLSLTLSQLPFSPPPTSTRMLFFFSLCGIQSGCKCIFYLPSVPAFYAKAGLKERMVMTVALWDSKRVKFKRSQHIRAPVNHPGPSARLLRAPECLADVCVYSCPRCSRACARACVRVRERCGNGGIKGSGSLLQCRTFSASFLLFCPLLTRKEEASRQDFGHKMQRHIAALLNKGGDKKMFAANLGLVFRSATAYLLLLVSSCENGCHHQILNWPHPQVPDKTAGQKKYHRVRTAAVY